MCRSIPGTVAIVMLGTSLVHAAAARDEASAPAALSNWSGWHLGAHGGYGLQRSASTVGFRHASPAAAPKAGIHPLHVSRDFGGAVDGLLLGYRFQIASNWLLGAQTDYTRYGHGIRLPHASAPNIPAYFPFADSAWHGADWFGTLRARADYTAKNWLLYATAGGVYARNRPGYGVSYPAASAAQSPRDWGWVAGGGVEYGWSSWSARFEYLHLDLGSRSLNAPHHTLSSTAFTPNGRNKYDIFRAAVNYRF